MRTLDLRHERMSVEDLLKLASSEAIRVLNADGHAFVIEDADEFEKEVELLGKSERFQRFLDQRFAEPATMSLEDYRRSLE